MERPPRPLESAAADGPRQGRGAVAEPDTSAAMPEWSKGGVLRSPVFVRVGSNPTGGSLARRHACAPPAARRTTPTQDARMV